MDIQGDAGLCSCPQEGVQECECARTGFLKWTKKASHTEDRREHNHFGQYGRKALKRLTRMRGNVGKERTVQRNGREQYIG